MITVPIDFFLPWRTAQGEEITLEGYGEVVFYPEPKARIYSHKPLECLTEAEEGMLKAELIAIAKREAIRVINSWG